MSAELSVALTIAGSDPSGGAGLQADLKTFHQFGAYGTSVVTLVTVQNTVSVSHAEPLDSALVAEQLSAVATDIPPAAAKTGALGSASVIETVAKWAAASTCPLVVDPVMISKHGARLLAPDAEAALREALLPRATLLTPNLPEATALSGIAVDDEATMRTAADQLLAMGAQAVLLKGGHLEGEAADLFITPGGATWLRAPRLDTPHTHGTGCTYSAAITAGLATGLSLENAIRRAKAFVTRAISTAPGLGQGCGPLNHFADVDTGGSETGGLGAGGPETGGAASERRR